MNRAAPQAIQTAESPPVRVQGAESPPALVRVRIDRPAVAAGGWPAITSTARVALSQMGLARGLGALLRVNQPRGFDCPGCAWPEPADRSFGEFCENGAKAVAEEATLRRIGAAFFAEWSIPALQAQSDSWLGQQGRLCEPLVRQSGSDHYEPIGWSAAHALIARHLQSLPQPDAAVFYTSGRTSNEAAFLFQLLVRAYGTNNLPDCSNMCHESSGHALQSTIGVGKGTVQLADFALADLILVIGQNPGTNHPRMLVALQDAARRGCQIVSVNPLREAGLVAFVHPQEPWELPGEGTALAAQFVQVQIGGDVALFQALGKLLLARGAIDSEFIQNFTHGFESYRDHLATLDMDELVARAGLDLTVVQQLAAALAHSQRTIACWAMGLTQHPDAVANIQEVLNVLLLGGHIGRAGAGVCPVRGHSNVQGDRTMGIWERMPDDWLDRLGKRFGFSPPRQHGLDTVDAIAAMARGDARVFLAMGGNFLAATPDTHATAAALQQCDLTVQISSKLNRSHLVTGKTALILPCLVRSERDVQAGVRQFVTTENAMGIVQPSRGHLPPASVELRSEVRIVADLAAALLPPGAIPWGELAADYDRIRDAIADVVPGLGDFNAKLRADGAIVLDNPARRRVFATASRRANFTCHATPDLRLPAGQLRMMTLRSHDQYNTTIYGLDDRYRGIFGGRHVVFVHPDDLAARGLAAGDLVDVISHVPGQPRRASGFRAVGYDIPRGCCAMYFPEANPLIPLSHVAAGSQTPASKSVPVSLHAAAG